MAQGFPSAEKAILHQAYIQQGLTNFHSFSRVQTPEGIGYGAIGLQVSRMLQEEGSPLTWGEYSGLCNAQYYSRKAEIGFDNDFVTWPERTRFFGQTIARNMFVLWESMGRPTDVPFDIIEVGAGNGTLARTILDYLHGNEQFQDFYAVMRYRIIDSGDKLVALQQKALDGHKGKVTWVQMPAQEAINEATLGRVNGAFILQELLDDIPVERVTRLHGELKQLHVGINAETKRWEYLWREPSPEVIDYIARHNLTITEGVDEPLQLQSERLFAQIDSVLDQGGCYAFDYGYDQPAYNFNMPPVNYFGRIGRQRIWGEGDDIYLAFRDPGYINITSGVNFPQLVDNAEQMGWHGYWGEQGAFMAANGVVDLARQSREQSLITHSWEEMIALARDIRGYVDLQTNAHDDARFLFSVLTKGVVLPMPTVEHLEEIEEPRVTVSFPVATDQVVVETEGSIGRIESVTRRRGRANLSILVRLLSQTKIYNYIGHAPILDLTDPQTARKAIRKAGYKA